MGVNIEEVSIPILSYAVAMYYTIMPAEASTNLSRFDGIKYGLQSDSMDTNNIHEYYEKIRSE
ncbi:hypothetical protein KKG31_01820 [Patescibacteria group bacterium]|nr:hypothetical protein [Patescibacteria group bacterium]